MPTRQRNIAIVDDHAVSRDTLAALLEKLGFCCTTYESAAELIRSGNVLQADCLLLDVYMPGIDGLALQRSLQKSVFHIPVIIYTGDARPEIRAQAMTAGAAGVLIKPVSRQSVVAALALVFPDDNFGRAA